MNYYSENWTWTVKTTDAGTGGQIGVNTPTWDVATKLNLNIRTTTNRDMTAAFEQLFIVGNIIQVQHKTDNTRYTRYEIVNTPINNGDWWQFPVSVDESKGVTPTGNTECVVTLAIPGTVPLTEGQATAGLPGGGAQANRPGQSHD